MLACRIVRSRGSPNSESVTHFCWDVDPIGLMHAVFSGVVIQGQQRACIHVHSGIAKIEALDMGMGLDLSGQCSLLREAGLRAADRLGMDLAPQKSAYGRKIP